MNCPQCGRGNPEGAKFCNNCGTALPERAAAPSAPAQTSGLAVASLLLGIAGFLCCFFGAPAIVGLILGVLALNEINMSGGRLEGRGLAIAGIAVSGAVLASYFLFGLWALLASLGRMHEMRMDWMRMH